MDPLKQFRLDGRVAFITGASERDGAALAEERLFHLRSYEMIVTLNDDNGDRK
jgi:NAD(P)-dependent dehydrogenase (short-subunit alcohol dehydrogenase family)